MAQTWHSLSKIIKEGTHLSNKAMGNAQKHQPERQMSSPYNTS